VGILEQFLTTLLIGLLEYFQGREDLKALVRAQIEAKGLVSANAALGWKTEAVGAADGGATLRLSPDAVPIELPSGSTITVSGSDPDPVQPGTVRDSATGGLSSDRP
jgi:hypothetical protein